MIFERILADSLMAWSYMVGAEDGVVVIDPQLDYGIYLERARQHGVPIRHVLETHRHEDMVSGARGLAAACAAPSYYSAHEDLGYAHGEPLHDGTRFELGEGVALRVLLTPGHTNGHLCYVLERNGEPMMVFTGDTLFYGGVGRTDFYGEEHLQRQTERLYDSIYNRLAPLGEGVIVMPAHGAGSACGEGLDDVPMSTIGQELRLNTALTADRDAFIARNGYMHYKNPAFTTMEVRNVDGDGVAELDGPLPLTFADWHAADPDTRGAIIDIRSYTGFVAGHLPGSTNIPADTMASWAGWFFPTDAKLLLMSDDSAPEKLQLAWQTLRRGGYSGELRVLGQDFLRNYRISGLSLQQIPLVAARAYLGLDGSVDPEMADVSTLDVRQQSEYEDSDPIRNRLSIPLQELRDRTDALPAGPFHVVCGSGQRATVAASYLRSLRTDICPMVVAGGVNGLIAAAAEG